MIDLLDFGVVLRFGLAAFTRTFAVTQVKFQAYLELARFDVLLRQI